VVRLFSNKKNHSLLPKERAHCRKNFFTTFQKGLPKYMDWERGYKVAAHLKFKEPLNEADYQQVLDNKKYNEIAARAIGWKKTNLSFFVLLFNIIKNAITAY
jgi:hypothetical protein